MGLGLINDLRNRVKEFNEGLESNSFLKEIVQENSWFIVDLNTDDQLYNQGINNLGVSISDYQPYADYTIELKKAEGKPYNRVTLHDEGDFAGSFYVEIGSDRFTIRASDGKTIDLTRKYGDQILGLTDKNKMRFLVEYVIPELLEIRKKYLYGKK